MSSIRVNYLFNVVYQLLNILVPIVTAPYLARVLGDTNIGLYTLSFTVANYFLLFAMMGISTHGNRSIAKVRDDVEERSKVFWRIYCIQIISGFTSIILYLIFTFVFCNKVHVFIYLVQSMLVVSTLFDVSWYFFGLEKFRTTATRSIVVKVLATVSIFCFVNGKEDLIVYAMINTGSLLLSQLILWIKLWKTILIKKSYFRIVKEDIKSSLVLFLPVVAVSIYAYLDKIMIGGIAGVEQLAYYEYAYKIISAPLGLITALGTVMLPRMTHLRAIGKENEANLLIERSFSFISISGSPIMFGIMAVSYPLTIVMFGKSFEDSAVIMFILAITIMIISWANVIRTQYLIPQSMDKVFITSTFLGAIVNVVMNIALIKLFGAAGAAVATVAAESTVCLYQTYHVRYRLPISLYFKECVSYLVLGGVMFAVVFYIARSIPVTAINLLFEILCGTISYIILCLIFKRKFVFELFSLTKRTNGRER